VYPMTAIAFSSLVLSSWAVNETVGPSPSGHSSHCPPPSSPRAVVRPTKKRLGSPFSPVQTMKSHVLPSNRPKTSTHRAVPPPLRRSPQSVGLCVRNSGSGAVSTVGLALTNARRLAGRWGKRTWLLAGRTAVHGRCLPSGAASQTVSTKRYSTCARAQVGKMILESSRFPHSPHEPM